MRKKLLEVGYLKDAWAFKPDHLGISMMTPVTDGKHVFVSTAYGAAFCVDLDGQVVWKQFLGGGWQRGAAIPSPVLVDDLMIVVGYEPSNTFKKRNRDGLQKVGLVEEDRRSRLASAHDSSIPDQPGRLQSAGWR